MEFPFSVNSILRDEFTEVNFDLQCNGCRLSQSDAISKLRVIIDKMGDASARAQSLRGPITTAHKLTCSNHKLYIMTDSNANHGHGAVLGILKVGPKRLFIYDTMRDQHEMEPLCVLDFYVHESRQRQGCGHRMFDYMLKVQNIEAQHMAIDRPSPKFVSFLAKHYKLEHVLPQVNNFVVYLGFFQDRPSQKGSSQGRNSRSQNLSLTRDSSPKKQPSSTNFSQVTNPGQPASTMHPFSAPAHAPTQKAAVSQAYPTVTPSELDAYNSYQLPGDPQGQTNGYSRHLKLPVGHLPNGKNGRDSPPPLSRDGPSRDYQRLISPQGNESKNGFYGNQSPSRVPSNAGTNSSPRRVHSNSYYASKISGQAEHPEDGLNKRPGPTPVNVQLSPTKPLPAVTSSPLIKQPPPPLPSIPAKSAPPPHQRLVRRDTGFNIFGVPSRQYEPDLQATRGRGSGRTRFW